MSNSSASETDGQWVRFQCATSKFIKSRLGGNMKLTTKEKGFIESLRVARVATVSPEGVPHNVPVCPLFERDKVYFATERNAKKLRNIKVNPRVTVVFDEYTEAWNYLRGVM